MRLSSALIAFAVRFCIAVLFPQREPISLSRALRWVFLAFSVSVRLGLFCMAVFMMLIRALFKQPTYVGCFR
jgi:hypothetical protein